MILLTKVMYSILCRNSVLVNKAFFLKSHVLHARFLNSYFLKINNINLMSILLLKGACFSRARFFKAMLLLKKSKVNQSVRFKL